MKRTLIIPAAIALLTGMSAIAQENNTSAAGVNSPNAVTAEENDEQLGDLKVDALNEGQLETLDKEGAKIKHEEKMAAEAEADKKAKSEEKKTSADAESEAVVVYETDEMEMPDGEVIEYDEVDIEPAVADMGGDTSMSMSADVEAQEDETEQ